MVEKIFHVSLAILAIYFSFAYFITGTINSLYLYALLCYTSLGHIFAVNHILKRERMLKTFAGLMKGLENKNNPLLKLVEKGEEDESKKD